MKKYLISLLLFTSLLSFGQDLHTTINFEVRKKIASQIRLADVLDQIADSIGTASGGSGVFANNITVHLPGGNWGKFVDGDVIPSAGLTAEQVIKLAVQAYTYPTIPAFSITGQSQYVEVGTTLSGSKTFTWTVNNNSGSVTLVDIYDITASSTLLSNTANDGTQAQTITSITLSTSGANQQWRLVAHDATTSTNINSSPFPVIAYFYRFFGPTAATPTNSATVRGLPSSAFQTPGNNVFILNSGTTYQEFDVALPPGISILNVVDLDAFSADITSAFVLQGSSITVSCAGAVTGSYPLYKFFASSPYSSNHRLQVTTN
jgi:hypothetical protein